MSKRCFNNLIVALRALTIPRAPAPSLWNLRRDALTRTMTVSLAVEELSTEARYLVKSQAKGREETDNIINS